MTPEPWLTKKEIAAVLKISPRSVTRHKLPHMRVGGQNRYLRSECERHLRVGDQAENVVALFPERKGRAA